MKFPSTGTYATTLAPRKSQEWVPLLVLVIGIPWGIWSLYALASGGNSELVSFYNAAGWFFILAFVYLSLHGVRGLDWTSVPTLITFEAIFEFGLTPCWRFAVGDDQVDAIYVHAMVLTLTGFMAFWIGSLMFKREEALHFAPTRTYTLSRVALMSAIMLALGLLGSIVVWKLGIGTYVWTIGDSGSENAALPFRVWLITIMSFLTLSMLISAIEVFGKRSKDPLIRFVFWVSVASSIGFGAISGMKSELLKPFIYLVVVYTMTNRKIPRIAYLLPGLLIVIYPFVNAYRYNLNAGYSQSVNTITGQVAVVEKTFEDVASSPFSAKEQSGKSFSNATDRLSLLTYFHDIIALPAPSLLNGDEKIWFAPFYPLIPRFIWKDKPLLDKGVRLSVALGRSRTTSSAPTIPGDLYILYGTPGVIIGMLFYGILAQLYMNWGGGGIFTERRLFIYIALLIPIIDLEEDTVAFLAGLVLLAIRPFLVARFVYGPAEKNSAGLRVNLPARST